MSNPARAPTEPTSKQMQYADVPQAYFADFDKVRADGQRLINIDVAKQELAKVQLEPAVSFFIPKEHTIDPNVQNAKRPYLARASKAPLVARKRTGYGMRMVSSIYRALPAEGFMSKASCSGSMLTRYMLDGGTQYTAGRLVGALPRAGAAAPKAPVSAEEAQEAVDGSGVRMQGRWEAALRPYPLVAKPGSTSVSVNPKSSNGFPVLGKWCDPGAAELCMGLAETVRQEVKRAYASGGRDGVWNWLREQEKARPELVTLMGKTKADVYTEGKATTLKLRFYNVLPRQVVLNMQMSTQAMEGNATHLLNSDASTAIGVSLTHGGAEQLVKELERRLQKDGYAFTHVGDDSWVVVKLDDGRVLMFALDCSNFDLTQHSDVTSEVHKALHDELALIDGPSAALWYAYARQRNVVTVTTLNYTWKHAGPSGMPLQSKVNDMLMHVMVRRTVGQIPMDADEKDVASIVQDVGEGMGFTVRLEQYVEGGSVRSILQQTPFLYIGYYFWADEEQHVKCYADLPRTLAQLPYPGLRWMEDAAVQPTEAVRLGSIFLNLGIPPPELEPAFVAARECVSQLIREAVKAFGEYDEEKLRWALADTPWGPTLVPSLTGLLAVIQEDPGDIWLRGKAPLPSTSVFLENWADEVEEEERQELQAQGSNAERPAALVVRPRYVARRAAPTHPATMANVGRPPPTAVWGPDRPRRTRDEMIGALRGTSRLRRNAYVAVEDWGSDEESDYSGYTTE